jgi:hypothetical protein
MSAEQLTHIGGRVVIGEPLGVFPAARVHTR